MLDRQLVDESIRELAESEERIKHSQETIKDSSHLVSNSKEVISQVMREMGRKGGKIGGKRRLETMSAEKRSEIALKAARTRWAKKKH